MRKRHLAAVAVFSLSVTALAQAPALAADAPAGTLLHQVITDEAPGWAEPAGSTGITQASITGLPNDSSQLVAVTAAGTLEHDIRFANGGWQGWRGISQPGVTVENASIAGMPNGSSQLVEVTSGGLLKHDIRNADGSWQATGWGVPAGSTGISQASITALPNGSSEIVAVTGAGTLELDTRYSDGGWQGWRGISQPGVTVENASIAGMPNGSSQLVEVTSTGVLKHDIRNADGSWQATGWGTPAVPIGEVGDVVQASIAALPNGSAEIVVAFTPGFPPGINFRDADGSWDNMGDLWERSPVVGASDVSVAGMPNGTSQAIEIGQPVPSPAG